MKFICFKAFFLVLFFLVPGIMLAQKQTVIVTGIPIPVKIDPSTLSRSSLKTPGRDGKEHVYTGILLSDLLKSAGIALGNKRESITSYVILKAKDGYKSIFSLAEIDPLFAEQPILIADKIDGNALSQSDAPFQVIVPGDKIQTRWVRQLVSIELVRVE